MAGVNPSKYVNYISEFKKQFVTRNNGVINQTFKIDSQITDTYYFQFVNSRNQIISLSGRTFNIFGSYVDAKAVTHLLFETDNGTVDTENNILSFKLNTYTDEYIKNIKTTKQCNITIVETTGGNTQVVLRDTCLCYKRPIQEDVTPTPVVAGFGLDINGYLISLTRSVLSGDNSTIAINDNVISYIGTEYSAGDGIGIDNGVISLTAHIPTTVAELSDSSDYALKSWVEEQGYLTGVDLSDYALKSQIPTIPTNVGDFTNDVGYLTGVGLYIDGTDEGQFTVLEFGNNFVFGAGEIRVNSINVYNDMVTNNCFSGYALTSDIPLSTSQLINDTGFLSAISVYDFENDQTLQASGLQFDYFFTPYIYNNRICFSFNGIPLIINGEEEGYITTLDFGGDFTNTEGEIGLNIYNIQQSMIDSGEFALTSQIPSAVSQLDNDEGFITSSALTGISTDKLQNIVVDGTVQDSGFVMQYNPIADIVYNAITLDDGVLNLNVVSGFENDIATGKVATFENWIYPSGELTGVTFGNDLTFIGQLPSSFTSGYTQVFTRRIIRKNANTAIQQISYNYEFEDSWVEPEPPTPPGPTPIDPSTPLTFEAYDDAVDLQLYNASDPQFVSLQYSKNNGAWTNVTVNNPISLAIGDTVAFSGNNNIGFNNELDSPYYFKASGNGKLKVYGNIMSLLTSDFVNATDFSMIMNQMYVFKYLFAWMDNLYDASNLILPATYVPSYGYAFMFVNSINLSLAPALPATTLASYSYWQMFLGCRYSLTTAPILPATQLGDYCYKEMFEDCESLTSISVNFTDWNPVGVMQDTITQGWVKGVAVNGTFTCPTSLGTNANISRGISKCPNNWTVVNN